MTKSLRIELVRMELFPGSIDLSKSQKVMSNIQNWLETSITLFYFNRFGIWMLRKQTKAWDFGITKKPLTQSEQQGKEILNTLLYSSLFSVFFLLLDAQFLMTRSMGFRCLNGHSLGLLRLRGCHRVDALPQAVGLSDLEKSECSCDW